MSHDAPAPIQHFPRPILFGAGAVLCVAMLAAGIGRWTGSTVSAITAPALMQRDLRFEDRSDGGVTVRDARDGQVVELMAPGTNGFLRATLRGLVRQRMREDVGPEVPFRLTAYADGRLTLTDPSTSRSVELEAFGHSNAEVFAGILSAHEPRQP